MTYIINAKDCLLSCHGATTKSVIIKFCRQSDKGIHESASKLVRLEGKGRFSTFDIETN